MENPFSKTEKLFSVVTPIYPPTEMHLDQWAFSLSQQEYKNFEAIVVFDGPNRKGVNILKRLIKEYPNLDISYFVIPHAGACAARNYGAEKAKGEYIAFPGGDCYLYPESLKIWANEFEDPKINRVWGTYDLIDDQGNLQGTIGHAPLKPNGEVWYPGFKFSPYSDGTFPVRKSDFVGWDVNCKSLQDWELSIRMLKRDNFQGKDWKFIDHAFFAAEMPKKGGLSDDSHSNWQERADYAKSQNGLKSNDICVTSLGAPLHGFNVSEMLEADFLKMPSFKPHNYKMVYLLGFYPEMAKFHMDVFERNNGKNVIHWIGTDVLQLHWKCSFQKLKELRKWFEDKKVIHLCEADFIQKELAEIGIKAKVVPIPPKKLYKPMPLPEEFAVGIYAPKSDMYNEELMMEVVRSLPDIKFYFFGDDEKKGKGENWEHLGYIDYDEWMPKFSCNLRVTVHDGLPLTPLQFISAGRNVVTNTPLKGAIKCSKSREDIVKALRKAQESPISGKIVKYWEKELNHDKYIKTIRGLK